MSLTDQKTYDYGSFKLIDCSRLSALSNPAEVQSLNVPGYEIVKVLKRAPTIGIILLQASDQEWEYSNYVTDRMGLTGLFSNTGRRESVIRKLQEEKPGWTLVDLIEVASSHLAFLLKRPRQRKAAAGDS